MPHAYVNDVWLHYRERGEGEPVLLVMGLGAPLQGWDQQVPALSRRFRCILFDNRGVGRSDKPVGRYTIAQLVEDARQLLDHLRIDSAHLVGMSMGGMIAMELAARHPERVRSLTLTSTAAASDARLRWAIGRGAVRVTSAMLRAGGGTKERLLAAREATIQVWLPLVFSGKLDFQQEQLLRQLMDEAFAEGFSSTGTAGQLSAVLRHDARARLGRIATPTLVIGGTEDAIFARERFEELAYEIPGARLELFEGAPHGLTFTEAGAYNDELLRFLAQVR